MVKRARKGGGHQGWRRAGGRPHGASSPLYSSRVPVAAPSAHAFSLQEEARNTEHRHRFWSSDTKLRHKGVSFVSAGNLAGTLPDETRLNKSLLNDFHSETPAPYESPSDRGEPIADAIARSESALAQMHIEPSVRGMVSPPASTLFFEDTAGSSSLAVTHLPSPAIRHASPTPSDSSEEVVLFRGRNNVRVVTDLAQPRPFKREADAESVLASAALAKQTAEVQAHGSFAHSSPFSKDRRRNSSDLDDEALADYVENIRAQELDDAGEFVPGSAYATASLTQRTLGLVDGDELGAVATQSIPHVAGQENPHKSDWDPHYLEDFDNISTSSEVFGSIAQILRKRTRSSGLQYLVVFENSNEDEARWISASQLTREHDKKLAAAFEETVANVTLGNEAEFSESWSDESGDADEGEEDGEDYEGEEDEEDDEDPESEDLTQMMGRMSDEKLARLLAKQEELGIDSSSLLLFDGDDDNDAIEDLDSNGRYRMLRMIGGKRPNAKSNKAKDHFPSATLMADVLEQDPYGGFDVMDFERPSLKKKKKSRAADQPFDLSDDDLTARLVASWENDREKKRLKKQERAELRSQGLLGKRNKFKADLSAKYSEGMTFTQIRDEVRVFLNSPSQSRPFPPMDKRDRAALHQLASSLGLTSRSVGSGTSRFTTLIKTSRTKELNEVAFAKITARYQNRFIQRLDKRGGGKKSGFGGGGRYAAVTYQDGDVVGASAPEIGSDNKGRAMLEKMGWSSGTALGAVNNKGILQPVTHVVKTTKTGLG